MGRPTPRAERARRQQAMVNFRCWMESSGVSRQMAASYLGITVGHLSTLINANRIATEAQVTRAMDMMGADAPIRPTSKPEKSKSPKKPDPPKVTPTPKGSKNLRPLTKFETKFITDIATTWIKENKNASEEELVQVVRALSIGIRS